MPLLSESPRFLTYEELRNELENYRYREGWDLSVFMDPWEGNCLYVVAEVDNAYSPGDPVELRIRSNIPPIPSAAYFAIWLQYRLQLIELHECREHFRRRVDGRPVFDPHLPVEPGGKATRQRETA
jgi:hypothetical protein